VKEILAQIKAPAPRSFTAGLILQNNVVVETAPILSYMKRQKWTRDRVRNYCHENGWTIKVIYEVQKPKPRHG
jgi:hypothetical protein